MVDTLNAQGTPEGQGPAVDPEVLDLMSKKGWTSAKQMAQAYREVERDRSQRVNELNEAKKTLQAYGLLDDAGNPLPFTVASPDLSAGTPSPAAHVPTGDDARADYYRRTYGPIVQQYGLSPDDPSALPIAAMIHDGIRYAVKAAQEPYEYERKWGAAKSAARATPEMADFAQLETAVDALHEKRPELSPVDAYYILKGLGATQSAPLPTPGMTPEQRASLAAETRRMEQAAQTIQATPTRGGASEGEPVVVSPETYRETMARESQRLREEAQARAGGSR